jgi:hypothetical protein
MTLRESLLDAVVKQFGECAMRVGTSADVVSPAAYGDLIVQFPAAHPAVGDASVWGRNERPGSNEWVCSAAVSVGKIVVQYSFDNYDTHLASHERATRVAGDVVRFLRELFADRLLLWRSADGLNAAWRERGDAGHLEPLVIDDRMYDRYLWSGPLPRWRATPAILAKGRIADDREYQLVLQRLDDSGPEGFVGAEHALARRLVADYERGLGM